MQENTTKTVAFHTLGCRLNFSETGGIADGFIKRGYEVVAFGKSADVVFLNTCTVTDGADSTCRNLIRKAHKSSPEGKVVVAGCYAQMEADKISKMQGVDLILGTSEKYKVFDYLDEDHQNKIKIDQTNEFWNAEVGHFDKTRAFLKIQDGCNYICSFCIIPFARGRSRAISVSEAVSQALGLVAEGKKEIVLTGVNIGEYERSSGERLSDLVGKILEIEGLERLRLSSVEPNTITDELLELLASSPKAMPHFHIPLQSGDDQILKKMRRRYDTSFYRALVLKIAERFPGAAFGADIIAGFPGETDEQFENTLKLLTELPITHFHPFPYSKRKGTIASGHEDHIQHSVKKQRMARLIELGEKKLADFAQSKLGETSMVLFEQKNKDGLYEGHTEHFIKCRVESEQVLTNRALKVKLGPYSNGALSGELVS